MLLTIGDEEIEGDLAMVDEERGDVFLRNAVHRVWRKSAGAGAKKEATPCTGGGVRWVTRESKAVMINNKFISLITPTVFADVEGTP